MSILERNMMALSEKDFDSFYRVLSPVLLVELSSHGADAEDILQDAWCDAWKYRAAYDGSIGTFESWFRAILRNTEIRFLNTPRDIPFSELNIISE